MISDEELENCNTIEELKELAWNKAIQEIKKEREEKINS